MKRKPDGVIDKENRFSDPHAADKVGNEPR